jgi:hypothetical protein
MLKNTFRKFSYTLSIATLSLLVTTQSCTKNVDDVQAAETISAEKITELKTFLANSAGVSANMVSYSEAGESFVIDNDFAVTLKDAEMRMQAAGGEQKSSSSSAAQRIYTYKVTQAKVSTIKIYADATVSADWVAILDQAIINWNNMGSNIHYTRVTGNYTTTSTGTTSGAISAIGSGRNKKTTTSGGGTTSGGTTTTSTNPDIIVTSYTDPATSTIAYAYMPDSYGNAGNGISINNYYSYLTTAQKVFALTHEMGHSVGFTHTNGTYGNLIPGTPELDPSSIMNSTVLSWTSFTTYDVLAAKTVYPKL